MSKIREIHKFIDCDDGWTAEIWATVNDENGEVLDEQIIMSNKIFHGGKNDK